MHDLYLTAQGVFIKFLIPCPKRCFVHFSWRIIEKIDQFFHKCPMLFIENDDGIIYTVKLSGTILFQQFFHFIKYRKIGFTKDNVIIPNIFQGTRGITTIVIDITSYIGVRPVFK